MRLKKSSTKSKDHLTRKIASCLVLDFRRQIKNITFRVIFVFGVPRYIIVNPDPPKPAASVPIAPDSASAVAPDVVSTKLCRYCALSIPVRAAKCTNCDSWQDWRRSFSFSLPALSLLLAIISVLFSSGRDFYTVIMAKPKVDILLAGLSFAAGPLGPDKLTLDIVNNEPHTVLIGTNVWCDATNLDTSKGGLRMHFLRLYNAQGQLTGASAFAVAANTTAREQLADIEFGGVPIEDVVKPMAKLQVTCTISLSSAGASHRMVVQDSFLADPEPRFQRPDPYPSVAGRLTSSWIGNNRANARLLSMNSYAVSYRGRHFI